MPSCLREEIAAERMMIASVFEWAVIKRVECYGKPLTSPHFLPANNEVLKRVITGIEFAAIETTVRSQERNLAIGTNSVSQLPSRAALRAAARLLHKDLTSS